MKECEFQDLQVEFLKKKSCWVKCIVGGMYLSGMPDLQIRTRYGAYFHVENKVWRNKTPPTSDCLIGLLEGPQTGVILEEFWGYGIYCPIFAFNDHNPDEAFYFDGVVLTRGPWRKIAEMLASITNDDLIHHRSVRSQKFNHHIRERTNRRTL